MEQGTALFFNSIEGCKDDVINLKKRLEDLGWKCLDVKVNAMEDFQKQKLKISSKIMMVFFFGYGYGNQMFLGSSSKESVIYEVFYQKMSEFQEEKNQIILFSNICFKIPVRGKVKEYIKLEKDGHFNEVYHLCTETEGTCKRGSLLTHILLNNEEEKDDTFTKTGRKLYNKINNVKTWNDDEYYAFMRTCANRSVTFPSFSSKSPPIL